MKRAEHISAWFEPASFGSLLASIGPGDLHNRDPREFPLPISGLRSVGDGILSTMNGARFVLMQLPPWQFGGMPQPNLKRTFRRSSGTITRLLGNLGVAGTTPLIGRFGRAVVATADEKRWAHGFYVDVAEEWDDPYRFFRW